MLREWHHARMAMQTRLQVQEVADRVGRVEVEAGRRGLRLSHYQARPKQQFFWRAITGLKYLFV